MVAGSSGHLIQALLYVSISCSRQYLFKLGTHVAKLEVRTEIC